MKITERRCLRLVCAAVLALTTRMVWCDEVDDFLNEFKQKRESIRVVEAKFSRENVTPDGSIAAAGTLLYAKPKRIVFRHEDPEVPDTLIDGLRLYEYDEDLEQLTIVDLADEPDTEALFMGFEGDIKRLREAYEIELFEPGDEDCAVKGLVLRPKKRPAAEGEEDEPLFEQVRLFLRDKDYLPCRIIIVNSPDSREDMRVTDYKVNGRIDPRSTQFEIPEGTTVIENDEIMGNVDAGGKLFPSEAIDPDAQKPLDAEGTGKE